MPAKWMVRVAGTVKFGGADPIEANLTKLVEADGIDEVIEEAMDEHAEEIWSHGKLDDAQKADVTAMSMSVSVVKQL